MKRMGRVRALKGGTIAVEMVIILPILMFLLAGAFNLARLIHFKQKVVMAARVGAEAAVTPPFNDARRALMFPFDANDFFGKQRAEQAVRTFLQQNGMDPSRAQVIVYTMPYGWWAGEDTTIPNWRRGPVQWNVAPPGQRAIEMQGYTGEGVIHPFLYKPQDLWDIINEGDGPADEGNGHAKPFVNIGYFAGPAECACHRAEGEGPNDIDAIGRLQFEGYDFRPHAWMIGVRVEYSYEWPWMVRALYAAASVLAGNPVPDWDLRLKGHAAFPVPMSLPEIIAVHEHLREGFNPLKFVQW